MKTPLYHKIYCQLQRQIASQELKPGDALPVECELEKMFGVSRSPVRQALALLESEGLITRQPGKGTFVSDTGEAMRLWMNFNPFGKHFKRDWDVTKIKMVSVGKIAPPKMVRDFFNLGKNQYVTLMKRVRYVREQAVFSNQIYINPMFDVAKFIENGDFLSPRVLLMEKFSVEVTHIDDILVAEGASQEISDIMGVTLNFPLLKAERRMYSDNFPVLMDIFYANTNIWDYRVTFRKNTGKVLVSAHN